MFRVTVLLWLLYLEVFTAAPTDEFRDIVQEGELSNHEDDQLQGIIPGRLPMDHSHKQAERTDFLKYNERYTEFRKYFNSGATTKGKTFNIYDEHMAVAAGALFRLIQNMKDAGYDVEKEFNYDNINEDLLSYAFDLNKLYNEKSPEEQVFSPPFIRKPNFFVNGETIVKALKHSNFLNYNMINDTDESHVDQYYKIGEKLIINTNYSGWNLPQNGGEEKLNYFREDISLNSYYYGVHLMHPYWMSNQFLDEIHPRHAEYYYYVHQQLLARYYLEKEHLKQKNITTDNYSDFNPYLIHENGLPFPVRLSTVGDSWITNRARIQAIDIAIRECMARKLIIMNNATKIDMTDDNYVDLLAKLIRANFEGANATKFIRSLFGYGGNGYPSNEYNPAPSLLHHPETTLRDPIYWYMIQYVLKYFTEYKESLPAFDLSEHETDEFKITDANIPKITTYFDYYQFNINNAISKNIFSNTKLPLTVTARQKRLKHSQFTFNFTVESKIYQDIIVRLYLGPSCLDSSCWAEYSKFYEVDTFNTVLEKGINVIEWSPEGSLKLSNDEYYNMEGFLSHENRTNKYNMFKFPENLLIPRGLEKGLNLSLFIMLTPREKGFEKELSNDINLYTKLSHTLDNKPLGFPFHRPAENYSDDAHNYKFYNIVIYHKRNNIAENGYFSPHLY